MTTQQIDQLDAHAIKAMLDKRDEQIDQLTEDNQKLEGQVAWLNRQVFGKKAERYEDPSQHKLPFETNGDDEAAEAAKDSSDADAMTVTRKRPASGGRGKRLPIPDDLPRVERVYDLPEDEKTDPQTGQPFKKIGEVITEQLSFTPGSVFVVRHIRFKYAKPSENLDGHSPEVVTAFRAPEGLSKCLAAPSLLAQIAVCKYTDHLPLDRLVKIFKRSGFDLSKASMCRWVQGVGDLLDPLVALMKQRMLEYCRVIQTDETPVRQQAPGSGRTTECRFWPYLGQSETQGHYVVFDYTQGRSGEHPRKWFKSKQDEPLFAHGYLQCDGYAGLNGLFDPSGGWQMTRVGCWAHARRKFFEAKQSSHAASGHALGVIQDLYKVESDAKGMDADDRLVLRQSRSQELVDTFFGWCREQQSKTLPKSKLGMALTYALNQEQSLREYLVNGHLQIDNNACERSLRGIALGRKNWLFIGSPAGGQAAAQLFSVLGSAKLHSVEPLAYLTDVITRLPATPQSQLDQFLPDIWAKNQATTTKA